MQYQSVKIINNRPIAPNIYSLWLEGLKLSNKVQIGQFIMIQTTNQTHPFLPRPLSIADQTNNKIRIIYRVVGIGTQLLKDKKTNETIQILGPLGKPIRPLHSKNITLCAGGIGIAPLLLLTKKLSATNHITLFYGAKNKQELILLNELKPLCYKIYLTTDDGTYGKKGLITDLLFHKIKTDTQYLFISGPLPMLKQISHYQFPIPKLKILTFLEGRMGCGCGICFCCGIKTKDGKYLRLCQEGPVMQLSKIIL